MIYSIIPLLGKQYLLRDNDIIRDIIHPNDGFDDIMIIPIEKPSKKGRYIAKHEFDSVLIEMEQLFGIKFKRVTNPNSSLFIAENMDRVFGISYIEYAYNSSFYKHGTPYSILITINKKE